MERPSGAQCGDWERLPCPVMVRAMGSMRSPVAISLAVADRSRTKASFVAANIGFTEYFLPASTMAVSTAIQTACIVSAPVALAVQFSAPEALTITVLAPDLE